MSKKVKISLVSLAIMLSFMSIGYFLLFNNKRAVNNLASHTSNIEKNFQAESSNKKKSSSKAIKPSADENKYYVVYIKQKNGGSSFVPEKLNPDFRNDADYHINLLFDDNGKIINSQKIIEIDNFMISSQNKKEIKKIAGAKNYDAALEEIQARVMEIKKSSPSL